MATNNTNRIAGKEYIKILQNRALCDKFLKFCMVIGMDTRFSKTIASKLRSPSRGLYVQNPIWPPPIKVNTILRLLFALEPCAIPLFLCLGGKDSIYEVICVFQGHFQSERSFSRAFGTFPFLILSVHPIHFSFRRHVKTHYFQAAFNTPAPLIHLWLTALYKLNYLFTFLKVASKIVPNSVDTNYNISTIRNYGYKFDTNACIIRPRCSRSVATYSHQTFPWTICRSVCPSVCRSVCPVHCEKTADRIRMPFGIGRTGPGMRHVVGIGNRSTGRGTFGAEFGMRHCNQWGFQGVRMRQRRDAALFPNYFGQTCYI